MIRSVALRAVPLLVCAALALLFALDSPSAHGSPDPQATAPALDANDVIFADQLIEELPPRTLISVENVVSVACGPDGLAVTNAASGSTHVLDPAACDSMTGRYTEPVEFSPDGKYVAISVAADEASFVSDTYFYDVENDALVNLEDIAAHTDSWLPEWSPEWTHRIVAVYGDPSVLSRCKVYDAPDNLARIALVTVDPATGDTGMLLCLGWEAVRIERWLDEKRVIVVGYTPYNTGSKHEARYLFALRPATFTKLGESIESESLYVEQAAALVRIRRLTLGQDPVRCALNMTDLTTLLSQDIELTFCQQPSELTYDNKSRRLAYLYRVIDPETSGVPEVHVVGLEDHTVSALPVENPVEIGPFSPDGRYLPVVTDTSSAERSIYFWDPLKNPTLVVFDLRANAAAYTVAVPDEPFSVSGMLSWSPDGSALLMEGEQQAVVLDVAAQKQVPVTRAQATDTFRVTVEWYGEDGLLLVEAIPTDPTATATLGRWVIDPDLD